MNEKRLNSRARSTVNWLAALCAIGCLSGCSHRIHSEKALLFTEEFNGISSLPDTTVWQLCRFNPTAWAQHFEHVKGYETVRVEDGYLKLTVTNENGRYKNGGIRTRKTFPLNTRLEVRARLCKKVRGGFPAIWQMPTKGPWPATGEIDLMEWVQGTPNRIYQTIHYDPEGMGKDVSQHQAPVVDVTQWHVYAVDRTPETLIFYLDGQETWRFINSNQKGEYPFSHNDYDLILNFSLGGKLKNGRLTWPGPIHDKDLPAELWIDWVRVTPLSRQ